jgi:hypothetical protein
MVFFDLPLSDGGRLGLEIPSMFSSWDYLFYAWKKVFEIFHVILIA